MAVVERSGKNAGVANAARKPLIIDTDVHESLRSVHDLVPYLSPAWQRYIVEYGWSGPSSGFPYWPPTAGGANRKDSDPDDGPAGSDRELLSRQLFDDAGISIAVLNGFFHIATMHGWYEFADQLAVAYNDWQIENWLEKDQRFRGSVLVNTHDSEVAAREVERVGGHPQMVQVFLPLVDAAGRGYGDPHYRRIFEAASRHNLVVTLHHGPETQGPLGYPRYYLEWHVGLPAAGMAQVTSLVCSGVFDELPELKVVLLELGFTWAPHLMSRMDQQYRELRAEVPWLKRMPSEYIRQHIRLTTQPIEEMTVARWMQIIDQLGSDEMIMFASDYPHWDFDSPERVLPASLDRELKKKVMYRNAAATYTFGDVE